MKSGMERTPSRYVVLVGLALVVGGVLVAHAARISSATYDEVAYLRIAATWWRTGRQDEIARMGSPLLFWKLQQTPILFLLDRSGHGPWIDNPMIHQAALLPIVRMSALWVWALGLILTAAWARVEHGPKAMAFAAWMFALSPNLLGHGSLLTMELPLVTASAGMCLLFARFLATSRYRWFVATAALGGVAFSCKFTAVVLPPLFGLAWWWHGWRVGRQGLFRMTTRVALGMMLFGAILVASNVLVTGGARLPLSERTGTHPALVDRFGRLTRLIAETPIPQDWTAFARQMNHQRSGGPSYLLGERRHTGWWYYYFVCLAVKVPLSFWMLVMARLVLTWRRGSTPAPSTAGDRLALMLIIGTLAIVALGSSRNYGFRYLLFLAPAAIVWLSVLAEATGGDRLWRGSALVGLAGQAVAVALVHPHELSYFNALAGGPECGKYILADSNLDWGQGARALVRLQKTRPELQALTLYYFGDTDPAYYGVSGTLYVIDAQGPRRPLPPLSTVSTPFTAVSRSLQYGPWGPEGFFSISPEVTPAAVTDDHTIAVYRTADLQEFRRPDRATEPSATPELSGRPSRTQGTSF